jgi:hypothetical protein
MVDDIIKKICDSNYKDADPEGVTSKDREDCAIKAVLRAFRNLIRTLIKVEF